jgi:hypothetical protein
VSKSTPTPPPAPNPTTVANAQTGTNIDTQAGNLVGTSGPGGSTNYTQSGSYKDPNTGQVIPQWTQNTQLSPLAQSIYTGTQQTAQSLLPTAQNLAGEAATSTATPLNVNGANNSTIQAGPQALDPTVTNAIYSQSKSFLDPQFAQQQKDLQDQLSRQGISVGSDAYNSALTNFNNTKNQAYNAADTSAISGGAAQANNMYNLAVLGQNQQLGQQQTVQSQPLSLLSQLYGGQATVPVA